jgi:uncharacterized membrane protein YkvA (DUF1232 family)
MSKLIETWKRRALEFKIEVYTIYLAYRDPRVPWYTRVFAACVVGYVFSPIDLIPDFIPVLGYLDDLILVPLGVMLAVKMIPAEVLAECRAKAREGMKDGQPISRTAAVVIVGIWLCLAAMAIVMGIRLLKHK